MATDNTVYIPSFLSDAVDEYGIAVAATCAGEYCAEAGCCTTECSQYCMSCTSTCQSGESCTESCSEGSGGGISCGEGGSCSQGCSQSCSQSAGFSGYFTIGSITESSVRVSVTIDSSYAYYRVFCRLSSDSSDSTYDSGNVKRSSNFSVTISGLEPDTTYVVNVGYSNVSAGCTWIGGETFTTEEDLSLDMTPWSWTKSNGSATASETAYAHGVLYGTESSSGFSHKVWNDLVDKVSMMRLLYSEYGYDWDIGGGQYLSKANCYVEAGDTLSAEIYNAVRYQIGSIKSTGITDKSRGDEILGYYIIHLTDVLNAIIAGE